MTKELIYRGNGGLAYGIERIIMKFSGRLQADQLEDLQEALEQLRRNRPICTRVGRCERVTGRFTLIKRASNPDQYELRGYIPIYTNVEKCWAEPLDDFILQADGLSWGDVEVVRKEH